jgi:hypothetical protein
MHRRELLKAAAAALTVSLVPRNAEAAWLRVGALDQAQALSPSQTRLVTALADTIIPRTDTPGANDVGVLGFIRVIVAEYYEDNERNEFLSGLDAIDALARQQGNAAFADLSAAQRVSVMTVLEQPADNSTPAARAYSRLKGLVVHGYLTSERVQREVLKTNIMPGRFDGAAPYVVRENGTSR